MQIAKWIALLVSISLIISCGMSRSSAGSIISAHDEFKKTKKSIKVMSGSSPYSLGENTAEVDKVLQAMQELGLTDSGGSFTPKGRTVLETWEKNEDIFNGSILAYNVPVGERELDEVTGLSEITNPLGSFMEAQFTWHWKPTTDIGKAMKIEENEYQGAALLQKFDDGWRVAKMEFEYNAKEKQK